MAAFLKKNICQEIGRNREQSAKSKMSIMVTIGYVDAHNHLIVWLIILSIPYVFVCLFIKYQLYVDVIFWLVSSYRTITKRNTTAWRFYKGKNILIPLIIGGNSSSQIRSSATPKVRIISNAYFLGLCERHTSECRFSNFFLQVGTFTEYPPLCLYLKILIRGEISLL